MAPVLLSGVSSVSDRTLFTRFGPIVKQPLALLTGPGLMIISATTVRILSANFTSADIGKTLSISGSAGGRNDGIFTITETPNSITAELGDANFEIVDETATTANVVALANAFKTAFNKHLTHQDFRIESPYLTHLNNDTVNAIVSSDATNVATSITLLNEIRIKYLGHASNTGGDFHINSDQWNITSSPASNSLSDAVVLANELRTKYEAHRLERRSHFLSDMDSRIVAPLAAIARQSFPADLVGPFVWTLYDPRRGMIADSPDDIVVRVNGSPVSVVAVFGMIGAVVLPAKPSSIDTVSIDYDYIDNPPARFLRLNSPEFVLNQDKNNGIVGLPNHKYRARSYLIDPGNTPDLISGSAPYRSGWKYKAYEREYSATLNDPSKLLLNSPVKKIKYPVLQTFIEETTISYDPTTLPQDAKDPWKLEGAGDIFLSNNLLTIVDSDLQNTVSSKPPFYTHTSDIVSASLVSAAYRVLVSDYQLDGVFTGVGFGLSDGYNVALVGFVQTEATNLTSAISLTNSIKANFNAHAIQPTVHGIDDSADQVIIVDAKDLQSLIILLNALKLKYNEHLNKADTHHIANNVHKDVDASNIVYMVDASDLATAISLANLLRINFNSHRSSYGIHYSNDIYNEVFLVKQIGVLTNKGASEFQDSWEASALDWAVLKTYRVYRDPLGDVHVYTSGDVSPLISVAKSQLPSISDLEGKFDPVQQIFFGSVSREATSVSSWGLIRANISPLDSNLLEDNKKVDFNGSVTPETDYVSPWITLGHGGTERVMTGGGIQTDSTCSAVSSEIVSMGASSGAFRGYMRFEPMLAPTTSCTIEFSASIDYHTFSLGNRSDGLFIDDGQQSVHFAFLYFSPAPAKVVGRFPVTTIPPGYTLFLSLDGRPPVTITFGSSPSSAAAVSAIINAAMVEPIASDDGSNHVQLIHGMGVSSYIAISGGSAMTMLGFSIGKYFGSDSNPEPRISWFGENPPDSDVVPWVASGSSSVSMLGTAQAPVMRIDDSSTDNYAAFTISNSIAVTGTISPASDWKLDARVVVNSFTAGDAIFPMVPFISLHFAGVLVNVDEGPGGKSVELHYAVDAFGNPYLNLVTFDASTNCMVLVAQYVFAWNDGNVHSFNIFTNKVADQLFVHGDGSMLTPVAGSPTYTSLKASAGAVPSATFGSGSEPVSNIDLRTSTSVVDWYSVAIFRDNKLSDPLASMKRYVGIHRGGDPALMSSWYVANVDWSMTHTYRIVRDPTNFVIVYVDNSDIPILSISYDPLTLPPCSSSFLSQIANSRSVIAWGALSPQEISRTRWGYLKYSMGKLTLTDRIVPPHQVLNQANAVASPEHLMTAVSHDHGGFTVYSGGTPVDDFMADATVAAFTILGEGTPPVPMTQNLESRGGLVRSAFPTADVSALDFMNYRGFLGSFENDYQNTVKSDYALTSAQTVAAIASVANAAAASYMSHRARHDVAANVHPVDDGVHLISAPPAIDLPSSLALLANFRAVFNGHLLSGTYHVPPDMSDQLTSPFPSDQNTCAVLCNEIVVKYNSHLSKGFFHHIPGIPGPYFDIGNVTAPNPTDAASCLTLLAQIRQFFVAHSASLSWHGRSFNYSVTLNHPFIIQLANQIKSLFNKHLAEPGAHQFDDALHRVTTGDAYDVASACDLARQIKIEYNLHIRGQYDHYIIGTIDSFFAPPIPNQLQSVISLANEIRDRFNSHLNTMRSHVEIDKADPVFVPPAVDLSSTIVMANALKLFYNRHTAVLSRSVGVHVRDDVVNVVVSPDATDIDTATILLNETKLKLGDHRVQPGVHSSAAFIRLDAPSGVLYEGMKFWKFEDGTPGLVHPFADSDAWHLSLISVGADPSTIVAGDNLVLSVDDSTVSVLFQLGDNTLSGVLSRINSTIGCCLATASSLEVKLTSPTPGPGSLLEVVSGTAVSKLGLAATHIVVVP